MAEALTKGAMQKIWSGMNEANFQPVVSFVRTVPSAPGKKERMKIEITDGDDTATAVVATSKLADMMGRGGRFLKLTDFYTAGSEASTRYAKIINFTFPFVSLNRSILIFRCL